MRKLNLGVTSGFLKVTHSRWLYPSSLRACALFHTHRPEVRCWLTVPIRPLGLYDVSLHDSCCSEDALLPERPPACTQLPAPEWLSPVTLAGTPPLATLCKSPFVFLEGTHDMA